MEEALKLAERVGQISQTAKAAHTRMDNLESIMREALKDLTKELRELNHKITLSANHEKEIEKLKLESQSLRDHMNQNKGSKASYVYAFATLIASISAAAAVAKLFIH